MRRLWVLVALVFLTGCTDLSRQVQVQTANAVAYGANAALPVLVQKYRSEGDTAIETSSSREQAVARITALKASWAPIWKAWEALRLAQHTWATVLERGGDLNSALAGLKSAYCCLQVIWPRDIPALPMVPVKCIPKEAGEPL